MLQVSQCSIQLHWFSLTRRFPCRVHELFCSTFSWSFLAEIQQSRWISPGQGADLYSLNCLSRRKGAEFNPTEEFYRQHRGYCSTLMTVWGVRCAAAGFEAHSRPSLVNLLGLRTTGLSYLFLSRSGALTHCWELRERFTALAVCKFMNYEHVYKWFGH